MVYAEGFLLGVVSTTIVGGVFLEYKRMMAKVRRRRIQMACELIKEGLMSVIVFGTVFFFMPIVFAFAR